MVLKFTSAPSLTEPIQSSETTGNILGGSKYHAFTLFFPSLKGIEISKGLDKSIVYFFELYFISVIKTNRV